MKNECGVGHYYGLYDNKKIVGFCCVRPFPHPIVRNMRRCHRLVILPDYQGIGLGTMFLTKIAEMYKDMGKSFYITTTLKNFAMSLFKSRKFVCTESSVHKNLSIKSTVHSTINATLRKVKVCTFKYVG